MSPYILLKFRRYISPSQQQNDGLNINTIFKPFYITLTFFGLFPDSYKYSKQRNCFKEISNSIFINTFCAVFYTTLMCAFCIVHIRHLFSTNSDKSSLNDVLIAQLNYLLEICSLVVYGVIAYFNAFLNRHKYVKILNAVTAIWISPRNRSQNEILAGLRFQVNITAMGSIAIATILHLFVNLTRPEGVWKIVLVSFTGVLPSVIQTITLAFYYVLVMMVVAILSNINQQLMTLTKQRKTADSMFLEVEARRPSTLSLSRIEQTYTRAYEIKCDINDAFQAPILFSTIQSFHCIISEAYVIYHGVMLHMCTLHEVLNCMTWITVQLLKVYSLSYSGNVLRNEVTKIGLTLHAIPTERQDLKTFMEIQHFTTLMNYQGFVINVYGYFSLNATLMSTMIANVAMYLIILIQFDKSDANSESSRPPAM